MAPVSRPLGRPHMSSMTSMSRWIPSGSTGRSPTANRPRLDEVLLSRPPRGEVPRGRRALVGGVAALPGCQRFGEHGAGLVDLLSEVGNGDQIDPHPDYRHAGTLLTPPAHYTSPSPAATRVEKHLGFLRFSGASWLNRDRQAFRIAAAHRRSPTRACADRPAPEPRIAPCRPAAAQGRARPGTPAGARRHHAGHVTEPEAGDQAPFNGNSSPSRSLSRSQTKCAALAFVVDAVQAAVRRDDTIAQDLAQPHHLECRRATLRVTVSSSATRRTAARQRTAHRVRQPFVQLGLVRLVGQRRGLVLGHHCDVVSADTQLRSERASCSLAAAADAPAHQAPERGTDIYTPSPTSHVCRPPPHRRPILSAGSPRAGRMVPPPCSSTTRADDGRWRGRLRVADALGPHHLGVPGARHVTDPMIASRPSRRHRPPPRTRPCRSGSCPRPPRPISPRYRTRPPVDHRTVHCSMSGLDHVPRDDVRQGLLEDIRSDCSGPRRSSSYRVFVERHPPAHADALRSRAG